MTVRNRGMLSDFSRWVAPFMSMAVHNAGHKDLAALKRLLKRG